MTDSIHVGTTKEGAACALSSRYANRHVLITGATGSGKSVSVMRICDELSRQGVPVLAFDAKGDLSGLAVGADGSPRYARLLDAFGATGARAALSFSAMGADATSRALGLSFAQAGAVDMAFDYARRSKVALHSPADLERALDAMTSRTKAFAHGVSIAVIHRALLRVDSAAFEGARFDALAAIESTNGIGQVSIFDARRLADSGPLYGAAICQALESLFRRLPEIGDAPRPKLALVIDEAHLLFAEIEPQLLQRVERIVRLIRSKGVALILASQSPADIPPIIAAQCASRIQHALRSATPSDARAVRTAAESMPNPDGLDVGALIGALSPGQALVSLVGTLGSPSPCALARIALPDCRLGALTDNERRALARGPATGEGPAPGLSADNATDLATIAVVVAGAVGALALTSLALGGIGQVAIVAAFAVGIYVLRRPLTLFLWIVGIGHHHSHGHHNRGRH